MSTDLSQIQIGQRFSFEVYPTAILGNNFKDVILEATLGPDGARSFGTDIAAMHANVYRTLPPTVPNDPLRYNWIRVKHPNGQYSVLGVPYIRPESIVVATTGRLTLTIDNVNQADETRILNALAANGYTPSQSQLTQQ